MSFCKPFFTTDQKVNAGKNVITEQSLGGNSEALAGFGTSTDALFESIRFNLQSLLQSEAPMVVLDSRLEQIQRSNWRYGVIDIQSNNRFMDAHNFAAQLQQAIAFSEPRLSQIKVLVVEHPNNKQAVHFHLTANISEKVISQYRLYHLYRQMNKFSTISEDLETAVVEFNIDMDTLTIEETGNDNFQ